MRTGYSYSNFYIGNSFITFNVKTQITPLERFFFSFQSNSGYVDLNQVKFR